MSLRNPGSCDQKSKSLDSSWGQQLRVLHSVSSDVFDSHLDL